jgi:hypothetical protein
MRTECPQLPAGIDVAWWRPDHDGVTAEALVPASVVYDDGAEFIRIRLSGTGEEILALRTQIQLPHVTWPGVEGTCPECGSDSIRVNLSGHLECSYLECPDPTFVGELLLGGVNSLRGQVSSLAVVQAHAQKWYEALLQTLDTYGALVGRIEALAGRLEVTAPDGGVAALLRALVGVEVTTSTNPRETLAVQSAQLSVMAETLEEMDEVHGSEVAHALRAVVRHPSRPDRAPQEPATPSVVQEEPWPPGLTDPVVWRAKGPSTTPPSKRRTVTVVNYISGDREVHLVPYPPGRPGRRESWIRTADFFPRFEFLKYLPERGNR